LRGKNFCYFHQRVNRRVAIPPESTIEPHFILDNEESIQHAIMHTLTAIVRGTMDHKTATLVLRGLNIAVRNCTRNNICFDHDQEEIVREVPNYGRQYLLEHPEYGAPITDAEVQHESSANIDPAHEQQAPEPPSSKPFDLEPSFDTPEQSAERKPPSSIAQEDPTTPATEPATMHAAATTTLSTRQSKQWRQIRSLQSSFEGARRGNLKDLKTCFHLAGLFPAKPK
jgi:hypothetical protein